VLRQNHQTQGIYYLENTTNYPGTENTGTLLPEFIWKAQEIIGSRDPVERGYRAIVWGPDDTMVGPFPDAKSPYHKTKQGEHFVNTNRLCFVCHYNGRNINGKIIYSTGPEYEESGSDRKCVDCHMSEKHTGVLTEKKFEGYRIRQRKIRSHLFMGARNGDILKRAMKVGTEKKENTIFVTLQNLTPHRVPTGFGSREVVLEAVFELENGSRKRVSEIFRAVYKNESGNETIPHLAVKTESDSRLDPNESRKFSLKIPDGSVSVRIDLYYRLIGKKMAEKLERYNAEGEYKGRAAELAALSDEDVMAAYKNHALEVWATMADDAGR